MTNTTAAQPLDLDKLEAHVRSKAGHNSVWLSATEVVALIAQARAAQPESAAPSRGICKDCGGNGKLWSAKYERSENCESCKGIGRGDPSATGTTGASELPRWIDDQKGKDPLMDDMLAYIIDLRAQLAHETEWRDATIVDLSGKLSVTEYQLAAKGQGDDYTVGDSELAGKIMTFLGLATTQSMEPGADPLRDRLAAKIALWRPAAPASAQPSDMADAYVGAREDMAIWKKRALEAEESCRRLTAALNAENGPTFMGEPVVRAQPDRGAAQVPDGFVWPEPPPSKGQSHVLFEDGYAEGWAKAIDTVRSRLAAAPSPASQPVAPEAAQAGGLIAEVQGCFQAAEVEGLAAALAETTDLRLKDLVERRLMHALYAANAAKDTTVPGHSEREAANVGGLSIDLIHDLRDAINIARDRADGSGYTTRMEYWKDVSLRLEEYVRSSQSPATIAAGQEAANAKDADRYRWLLEDPANVTWGDFYDRTSHGPNWSVSDAIDAAMSQAKGAGKEGGAE